MDNAEEAYVAHSNWWETDGWFESYSEAADNTAVGKAEAAALLAVSEAQKESVAKAGKKDKIETFKKRLEKLFFTYVTVFVNSWAFSGVLVGVFDDFFVLVKGCHIIEVSLREVEAVKHLAWGCPEKKQPQKRNVIVKDRMDTSTILKNLFSKARNKNRL